MKPKTIRVTFTVGENSERPSSKLSMHFEQGISLSALEQKDYKALQRALTTVGRILGPMTEGWKIL